MVIKRKTPEINNGTFCKDCAIKLFTEPLCESCIGKLARKPEVLTEAIKRYIYSGKVIPVEWISAYNELAERRRK